VITLVFFTDVQILILVTSLVILIGSTVIFHLDKAKTALTFLFIGAIGLGLFIASLDNFLVLWDEQYHALVAKNMLQNPLKPPLS
jgi:4-amino-4-deoxy-L-arabinose transferase